MRLAVPELYNVYNALAAASPRLALGVDAVVTGLDLPPRVRPLRAVRGGDHRVLLLLVKNAGANEALRTLEDGGVPEDARGRAQRPDRRRARRLLDLGRRLRAPPRREAASS